MLPYGFNSTRRVHLVRFTRQLVPVLSINSSPWVCNRVGCCCLGPRCLPGQRAVHEAPRQQDRQYLLLPHPKTSPDSLLCQQKSPETTGDITRLIPLGLLKRCPRRPPCIYTNNTSTCTECRRPSRARSWPPIQHHNSSERPTLAAGQASNHLQSHNSDASSSSSSLSSVLGQPCRVQLTRLSSATLLHYDQSSRDTENSDPVRKTSFLYLQPWCVEQSLILHLSPVWINTTSALLADN